MRTFPKELAEFRRMVESRGAALRLLPYQDLLAAANRPIEHVDVQGRPATIAIIVLIQADGSLEVVVQGFMPGRWLRFVKDVAVDGFYMHPNGCVEAMPDQELFKFE